MTEPTTNPPGQNIPAGPSVPRAQDVFAAIGKASVFVVLPLMVLCYLAICVPLYDLGNWIPAHRLVRYTGVTQSEFIDKFSEPTWTFSASEYNAENMQYRTGRRATNKVLAYEFGCWVADVFVAPDGRVEKVCVWFSD